MDYLYGPFKTACRERSQAIYGEHLQKNSEAIQKMKADIAQGIDVPSSVRKKIKSVVRMEPEDVGRIVFGDLQEDGTASEDSPFAIHFTTEKIRHGASEVDKTKRLLKFG